MIRIKTYKPILFILFSLALFSCDSDNDSSLEDNEQVSQEIIAFEEKIETNNENNDINTFDGTEVIEKILGKWKRDANGLCVQKNIMEFKLQNIFKLTKHSQTFTQQDLRDFGIFNVPIGADFNITGHKGNNVAVFDTRAECQFIETSTIGYVVKDEKTIDVIGNPDNPGNLGNLGNNPNAKIILDDDNTLRFVYLYPEGYSITQFYKKL